MSNIVAFILYVIIWIAEFSAILSVGYIGYAVKTYHRATHQALLACSTSTTAQALSHFQTISQLTENYEINIKKSQNNMILEETNIGTLTNDKISESTYKTCSINVKINYTMFQKTVKEINIYTSFSYNQ